MNHAFADHFSSAAADYASARPQYPHALFAWIASISPARTRVWEAGCGSGQASRDLAKVFDNVFATDPSAAQIAQALHWFDREAFFAECARVLKPGGVLVAWGYQDREPPQKMSTAVDAFRDEIASYWPPERAFIDSGYAEFEWPFANVETPILAMTADWALARLLGYFSNFSALKNVREATGRDPAAAHAAAIASAWGDAETGLHLRWPFFLHARRM